MQNTFLLGLTLLALLSLISCATTTNNNFKPQMRFIAMGDVPYKPAQRDDFVGRFRQQVEEARGAFAIHVGDIKGGSTLCTDELLLGVRDEMNMFDIPIIYTPGDNEWTDCHRPRTRNKLDKADHQKYTFPTERLNFIRKHYYVDNNSLGKRKISLQRQESDSNLANFKENVLWWQGKILFATLHVVGSNNNFKSKSNDWPEEYRDRVDANSRWMQIVFALAKAKNAKAVVLGFHASIDFAKDSKGYEGFKSFRNLLTEQVVAFKRPVLAIHGDEHKLRIDRPMPIPGDKYGEPVPNFYRLEVPGGYGHMGFVIVEVDLKQANPFRFQPVMLK